MYAHIPVIQFHFLAFSILTHFFSGSRLPCPGLESCTHCRYIHAKFLAMDIVMETAKMGRRGMLAFLLRQENVPLPLTLCHILSPEPPKKHFFYFPGAGPQTKTHTSFSKVVNYATKICNNSSSSGQSKTSHLKFSFYQHGIFLLISFPVTTP